MHVHPHQITQSGKFWSFPVSLWPSQSSHPPKLAQFTAAKGQCRQTSLRITLSQRLLLGQSPSQPSVLPWRARVWWTCWEARWTTSHRASLQTFALFSTSGQQSLSSRCALMCCFPVTLMTATLCVVNAEKYTDVAERLFAHVCLKPPRTLGLGEHPAASPAEQKPLSLTVTKGISIQQANATSSKHWRSEFE